MQQVDIIPANLRAPSGAGVGNLSERETTVENEGENAIRHHPHRRRSRKAGETDGVAR